MSSMTQIMLGHPATGSPNIIALTTTNTIPANARRQNSSPNDRREDKRDYGEADDTLNRVFEQREEIPFAFSRGTFDVLI